MQFLNKDRTQFMDVLRSNVNAYFDANEITYHGNGTLVFRAILFSGLFWGAFLVILFVPISFLALILLSFLMGVTMAGSGMCFTHDALHDSLSKHRWVNKVAGLHLYIMGGNIFNWKVHHNMTHHTFTNVYGHDEDLRVKGFLRFSNEAPLYKIHRYQHKYAYYLYSLTTFFQLVADIPQLIRFNKTGITKQLGRNPVIELFIAISVKLLVLFLFIGAPYLLTDFSFWEVLIGFVCMHLTIGFIFGVVFQLAHIVDDTATPSINTDGLIENEWAIHQLCTASNFSINNRLLNWYLGGLNFQVEHHLFPSICHVHFPAISPIVEKTAHEFGLPYTVKTTLKIAIQSHIRQLKKLGNPPINS